MRWMMRRTNLGDRGAVALLVTLVTVFVLLGAGAIVLNTGSWYAERAQLQNGADASALGVAQSCASTGCDKTLAEGTGASGTGLADTNANDNLATVDYVCGGTVSGDGSIASVAALDQCNSTTPGWTATGCPDPPTKSGVGFVDVHTSTKTSGGASIPVIGALSGKSEHIKACAQATIGAPSTCNACVPLTISQCEWKLDTGGGTQFATAPSDPANFGEYPPSYLKTIGTSADTTTLDRRRNDDDYDGTAGQITTNFYRVNGIVDPHGGAAGGASIAGSETVLIAKSGKNGIQGFSGNCKTGADSSDQTGPGQFGWLSESGAPCTVAINNNQYAGQSGAPAADCSQEFLDSYNNQTPIYIPVYSAFDGKTYTLDGLAAFVVTGWDNLQAGGNFSGSDKKMPSRITANDGTLSPNASTWANYCDSPGKKGGPGGTTGGNGTSSQCVYGYFTQALIPPSALPGGAGEGTNLGATSVALSG